MNEIQSMELEMIKEVGRIAEQYSLRYYLAYGSVLGAVRHNGFIPWDSDIDIVVFIDHYQLFCETIKSNIDSKYVLNNYIYDKNYDSLKARIYLNGHDHSSVHIDIFPLVGAPDTTVLKFLFAKLAYINYRGYFVKKVNANHNYKNKLLKRMVVKSLKVVTALIPDKLFIGLHNKLCYICPLIGANEVYNVCSSYTKFFIPAHWFGEPICAQFEEIQLPIPKEWDKYLTYIYGDYMIPKKENYI
jgi:lipopolysaccharide cholinephosphotransferase